MSILQTLKQHKEQVIATQGSDYTTIIPFVVGGCSDDVMARTVCRDPEENERNAHRGTLLMDLYELWHHDKCREFRVLTDSEVLYQGKPRKALAVTRFGQGVKDGKCEWQEEVIVDSSSGFYPEFIRAFIDAKQQSVAGFDDAPVSHYETAVVDGKVSSERQALSKAKEIANG